MATRGGSSVTGATEHVELPVTWRLATVSGLIQETPRAKTLVLDVPGWPGHIAGQHVDVRLTAEDGYQTERSYSIASAPEEPLVALTVERLEDGEVSPYLTEVLRIGDQLELRRRLATGNGVSVHHTFTREPPPDWGGFARRIDAEMLRTVGPSPMGRPRIYVCGSTAFVEQAAELLVKVGHDPASIRTERFGPTG